MGRFVELALVGESAPGNRTPLWRSLVGYLVAGTVRNSTIELGILEPK